MSTDAPDSLDFSNLDQYSDEEIEAYNEQKEREIAERVADLKEQEQAAVDTLRQDAQDSIETETVQLPSGVELEVRTRFTQRAESLQEQLASLEEQGAQPSKVKEYNAKLLAEMVETEGYDNPEVWLVAASDDDAGMVWMGEVTDKIVAPIREKGEELQGNAKGSGGSRNQTAGKQSGGWQKR